MMVRMPQEITNDSLEKIATEVRSCLLCKLSRSRKNAVPGEGQLPAKIMLIGEAPGKNEDEKGQRKPYEVEMFPTPHVDNRSRQHADHREPRDEEFRADRPDHVQPEAERENQQAIDG